MTGTGPANGTAIDSSVLRVAFEIPPTAMRRGTVTFSWSPSLRRDLDHDYFQPRCAQLPKDVWVVGVVIGNEHINLV